MFFKQGCAQNRSISAWREKPLGSKDRKGFSFNFCVHKRKVIIHCDQTVFKSLLSGSHFSFTAELSWHYPTLLGCCVEHSAAAGTVQVQKEGRFSWNMVGQDKVKGKSVFLQRFFCTVVEFQTVTLFMKETCALKSPFKIWGKEMPLIE